jgi:hypothetical protein
MTVSYAYTRLSGGTNRTTSGVMPRRLIGLAFWG